MRSSRAIVGAGFVDAIVPGVGPMLVILKYTGPKIEIGEGQCRVEGKDIGEIERGIKRTKRIQ